MPEIKEPSQRKRDAASANGKLARGSKTPEGKARSAMNAVTHGFTAATVILAGEDRGAFERLLAAYAERFQPVDAVEMDMLQDIVIAKWRHRRGAAFEAATIDDEVESQRADTYRRRSESTSELTRSALAYRDVEDRTGIISAMNRHQARQYREYRQAIRLLVEFQRDRPPNEKLQNDPSPINEHLENPGAPIQSEPPLVPELAADRGGHLLELPRPILGARPEESLQSVTFAPRDNVHVQVRDTLAHPVIHRDERPLSLHRPLNGASELLNIREQRTNESLGQVIEGLDMRLRDQQHMSGE
jgi:hypothetical protein